MRKGKFCWNTAEMYHFLISVVHLMQQKNHYSLLAAFSIAKNVVQFRTLLYYRLTLDLLVCLHTFCCG